MRMHTEFWLEKPEGNRPLRRPTRGRKGNIKMDLRENRVGRCGLGSSDLGLGPVAGWCEHGNEPGSSIKGEEFLD
jgi:hypothetical protein